MDFLRRKGVLVICLGLVLVMSALVACAKPAPTPQPAPAPAPAPQPTPTPTPAPAPVVKIEITSVANQPATALFIKNSLQWNKLVEERSKGELVIKHLGGPEVSPAAQQALTVQAGTIDIAYLYGPSYLGLVSQNYYLNASRLSSKEEKTSGFYDILDKQHQNAGLKYLGRIGSVPPDAVFYQFWGKQKIATLKDLQGKMLASSTTHAKALAAAFGMGYSVIKQEEGFTALQQGTIDAYSSTLPSFVDTGLYKAVKYALDHPYYCGNLVGIINLKKWNSIPERLQKIMIDSLDELQEPWRKIYLDEEQAKRKVMTDAGIEFVKLSPEEAKTFVDTAYKAQAESGLKDYPNQAAEIMKILKITQ